MRNNILLNGYVRLDLVNKAHIDDLLITDSEGVHKIKIEEKNVFNQIWNMYEKNEKLQKEVDKKFMDMWDSFESLKKVHDFWDSIPTSYDITQVGRILAHTNAKRCNPSLPDLL